MRPAAFLDRDGTIIEDAHYLADPSRVRVLPGAVAAVRELGRAGVPAVVITNQSGIAQGLVTEALYRAVKHRVEELFAAQGAPLAGSFHCPHYPSLSGPCECRKPRTGLHREAGKVLGLALDRSLYVGDRRRDVEPVLELGGYGILVPSLDTPESEIIWAESHVEVADSLEEAVRRFLAWLREA
jgi:histidinol-phosphate phosphatase family protein